MPAAGLVNYGMDFTSQGKLILFGGQKELYGFCALTNKYMRLYNDLWIYDASNTFPNFVQAIWIPEAGGDSKVFSLGGELIGVFNSNFKNLAKLIDVDSLKSYEIVVYGERKSIFRTAFGLARLNQTEFILYGGYNADPFSLIDPQDLIGQLSFSFILQEPALLISIVTTNDLSSEIGIAVGISIVCVLLAISFYGSFSKIYGKKTLRVLSVR
jgi:hypothetical protein